MRGIDYVWIFTIVNFLLQIVTPERTYYLTASCVEEVNEWLRGMTKLYSTLSHPEKINFHSNILVYMHTIWDVPMNRTKIYF